MWVRDSTGDHVRRVQGKATEWGEVSVTHGQCETAVLRERQTIGRRNGTELDPAALIGRQLNKWPGHKRGSTGPQPQCQRAILFCSESRESVTSLEQICISYVSWKSWFHVMQQPRSSLGVTLSARVRHPLEKRPFSSLSLSPLRTTN